MKKMDDVTPRCTRAKEVAQALEAEAKKFHPDTHCAVCMVPLVPEHAHMRCPKCGQRDSCCF